MPLLMDRIVAVNRLHSAYSFHRARPSCHVSDVIAAYPADFTRPGGTAHHQIISGHERYEVGVKAGSQEGVPDSRSSDPLLCEVVLPR